MTVDCVKDNFKYLITSDGRLMKFEGFSKNLQLFSKKLFLDEPTRWNNTYIMLVAALEFKEVRIPWIH